MKRASQKNIIASIFVIILVFLGFWFFLYLPRKDSIAKIRSQVLESEAKVDKIVGIINKNKAASRSIVIFEERYSILANKFPMQEEEGLKVIAGIAKKVKGLRLVSIKSEPRAQFVDSAGRKIDYEGKSVEIVKVSLEIKCVYKDLVRYLELLRKNLAGMAIVQKLEASREAVGIPILDVKLLLNLYLLS